MYRGRSQGSGDLNSQWDWGLTATAQEGTLGGDGNVLKLDCDEGCRT